MNRQRFARQFVIRAPLLAALALLTSAGALAQSRAAQAPNFELGMGSREIDASGSTSNGTLGVHAGATIPLGNYFGASVSGGYMRSTIRTRAVLADPDGSISGTRPSCRFGRTEAEAGLFARLPAYGKVGASYGVGRLSPNCGESSAFVAIGEDKLRTDSYRLDAEYYLGDFTVAAARTSTDLDDGVTLTSNSLALSWYPLDSLRLSLMGDDLYEQNTYGFELEHQPEFLGDALSVLVGYSIRDEENKVSTISFGLAYHFGTRVPLKTRDRHYR